MKRKTLKENFSQHIIDKILSGELKFGEKLKSEQELANEYFISKSVVHHGIIQLASKGFLEIKPRVGTFVSNYLKNGNVQTVIEIMKFTNSKFSEDTIQSVASEVKSLIEIKGAIDTLIIKLIGENLKDDEHERLNDILARFENCCCENCKSRANCCVCTAILFDFFCTLSEISGNVIISLMYHSFKLPIENLWTRYLQLHTFLPLQEYTTKLLQALKDKKTSDATRIINELIIDTTIGENIIV